MPTSQLPTIINNDDDGPIIETIAVANDPIVDTVLIDGSPYNLDDLLVTSNIHAEEFIALAKKNIDLARLAFTNNPTIKKILSGTNYVENLRQIVLPHESLALTMLIVENGKFWETIATPAFLWELANKHESICKFIFENDSLLDKLSMRQVADLDQTYRLYYLLDTPEYLRREKAYSQLKGYLDPIGFHPIMSIDAMIELFLEAKGTPTDLAEMATYNSFIGNACITHPEIRHFLLQEKQAGSYFHRIGLGAIYIQDLIRLLQNHDITSKLTMAQLHDLSKNVSDARWLDINNQELTRFNLYKKLLAEKREESTHEDICKLVDDYFHPKTEEGIKSDFIYHLFQAAYNSKDVCAQLTDPDSLASLSGDQLNLICNKHGITLEESLRKRVLASILLNNIKWNPESSQLRKHKSNQANTFERLERIELNYLLGVASTHIETQKYYFAQAALLGHKKAFDYLIDELEKPGNEQDVIGMMRVAEALCANPEWDNETKEETSQWVTKILGCGIELSDYVHKELATLEPEDDHYEAVCTLYFNLLNKETDTYRAVAKALGVSNPGKALEAYRKVPPHLLTPVDVIEMSHFAMMDVWNQQAEEVLASLSDNTLENKELIYQALDTLNDADKKEQRIKACLQELFATVTAYAHMPHSKADDLRLENSLNTIRQFLTELVGTHAQSYTRMENIVLDICKKTPGILINKAAYGIVMGYIGSSSALYKMGMLHAEASGDKVEGLTTARLWHQASNMQHGKNAGMTRLLTILAAMRNSANFQPVKYDVLFLSLKWIIENNRFDHLDFLEQVYQLPDCYTQIRECVAKMLEEKHEDVAELTALQRQLASYQNIQNQLLALEQSVATLPPRHVIIRSQVQELKDLPLFNNVFILQYAADILTIKRKNQQLDALQGLIDVLPNHHQTIRNKIAYLQTRDLVDMNDISNLDTEVGDTIRMDRKLTALQTHIDVLPIQYQDIRSNIVALLITDYVTDDDYNKCRTYLEEVKIILAIIDNCHGRAKLLPERFIAIKDAFNQYQNNEVLRMDILNDDINELIQIESCLKIQANLRPKIASLPAHYLYIREEFDDAENRPSSDGMQMDQIEDKIKDLEKIARRAGGEQAAMDVMLLPLAQLEKKLNNKNSKTKKDCLRLEVVSQIHQTLRQQMDSHFSQDFSNPGAIKSHVFRENCLQLIRSQLEGTNKGLKQDAGWQKRLAAWLSHQLYRIFPNSPRVSAWAKSSSAHFKVAPEIGEGMRHRIESALKH